eukprot:1159635-Pelagomonas_calceolata.AAC.2
MHAARKACSQKLRAFTRKTARIDICSHHLAKCSAVAAHSTLLIKCSEHSSDPTTLKPLSIIYLVLFHQAPDRNKHDLCYFLSSPSFCQAIPRFNQKWSQVPTTMHQHEGPVQQKQIQTEALPSA